MDKEGACYNREHSWPKSWWGESKKPGRTQHSDLHHLFPTDGYINQRRGSHPLGEVADGEAELTTANGAKLGRCVCRTGDGYCTSAKCFEPPDEYKGEFARAFFYMAVRYRVAKRRIRGECCANEAVNRFDIRSWMEIILRDWHEKHPPTLRERQRNDAVERWQGNRNPFIDHPELVERIFDF